MQSYTEHVWKGRVRKKTEENMQKTPVCTEAPLLMHMHLHLQKAVWRILPMHLPSLRQVFELHQQFSVAKVGNC